MAAGPGQIEQKRGARTSPTAPSGRGTDAPRGTCGPSLVALVGCVVLLNDRGRNAAPLAHLVATLFGPSPDFRTALPARPGPPAATPPATAATACLARVIDVGLKLFAELACVFGTEIDLVHSAIETEGHGLGRLAPIEVVDEEYLNLLCHG